MTALALLNSTTIDYTTQLQGINDLRTQIEDYISLDKLIRNYSHNINLTSKNINSILDKSFILPIYERNFDKIKQLVNSDFNDNEANLANKYSKAYMDMLEEKKKEELNINPLKLASQIEFGIVSLLSGLYTGSNTGGNSNANYNNEYFDNPIPIQERKLLNQTVLNQTVLNENNIIKDSANRGSYLINNQEHKNILEGFKDNTNTPTPTPTSTSPNLTKAIYKNNGKKNSSSNSNNNNKTNDNNLDITSKILSGDFIQYIMDFMNDKYNMFMQYYNNKFNNNATDGLNTDTYKTNINLEDNLIPAGFLLFILSMLFYFVDITS